MHPLVDFLNHGFLPFAGRSGEIERLLRFWRSTIDAHGLRAALLLGEAGVGKSRLIEALMPRVANAEGAVVHLKFYPESTGPIAPLLADALRRSGPVREMSRTEPEATLHSVAESLRRLCHIRATLLIAEDIHLLSGESLRDFSSLLATIADEPISLLCVARPVEVAARGIVEPFLVEEVDLRGLTSGDLRAIWRDLFGDDGDEATFDLLMEATRGNALALRSSLRGAVSTGALVQEGSTPRWSVVPTTFAGLLERNIDLLLSGMAAHLSPEERAAAGTLASLGEIVARETAEAMLDDAERMIPILLFKGVIVTTSVPIAPLPGDVSPHPLLAFTHSLLHKYLVDHITVDADRLVHVIAADLPLYSTFPFDLLSRNSSRIRSASEEERRRAAERGVQARLMLDQGGMEMERGGASEDGDSVEEGLLRHEEIVSFEIENGAKDRHMEDERLRLSMLGTIAVALPGEEPQPVRGSRLRALLGLMVANQMQRKPLAQEEFWRLGGGGEDIGRSRKTMHQGVLRLRELLGRETVITDTDVPRLNLDRVGVDLLEARQFLAGALDAVRHGGLLRGRLALASALDLARGKTPFPGLYDEIFEAAREEFENRLREMIIMVGRDLLREGDAASAGEILQRGIESIPEDEELAALLRSALEQQGKFVEAERLRMRMATAGTLD